MPHTELYQLLEQEIALVDQLTQVLRDEKIALASREFEKLPSFSEIKQELSEKLEASAQMRIALLSNSAEPEEYRQSLKTHLSQCSAEETDRIDSLNKQLAEKIIQCRESNQVNGQVISTNISTRQEILHAMTNHSADPNNKTYDQEGQIKASSVTGRHEKA